MPHHTTCMVISIKLLTMEHRIRQSIQSDCQWPISGNCLDSSRTPHQCGRREPGSHWAGSNQTYTTLTTLQDRKIMYNSSIAAWDINIKSFLVLKQTICTLAGGTDLVAYLDVEVASFITHLLSCWRRSGLWMEMKWKLWQTFVQHVCRRSPSWRNLIGWNQPRESQISKRSAPPTWRMSCWKEILRPLCTAAAAPKHSFITTPIFYVNAGDRDMIQLHPVLITTRGAIWQS